jgi:hypothetical protein
VQEIAWLIQNGLNFNHAKEINYLDRMPFVEHICSNVALNDYASPRILKSHLPLEFFPNEIKTEAKVFKIK